MFQKEVDHHFYISTACHHGLHSRCRTICKFCQERCLCPCHPKIPGRLELLEIENVRLRARVHELEQRQMPTLRQAGLLAAASQVSV